jgi:hypothetical protein
VSDQLKHLTFHSVATAVIMSITAAAPFGGPNDVNIGVAYISAFILVFFVRTVLNITSKCTDFICSQDYSLPNGSSAHCKGF